MIIVLVILGLVAGIAAARGPGRSHGLESRALIAAVTETLRGARGRAIGTNRPVLVAVNGALGRLSVAGGPTVTLPPGFDLTAAAGAAGEPGKALVGIRFAPDGSASGGRIVIADGKRHTRIGVDWLTGRITVAAADAP